jgi:hypothetical protein
MFACAEPVDGFEGSFEWGAQVGGGRRERRRRADAAPFAYLGADLQDLYGMRTSTIVAAAKLKDANFQVAPRDRSSAG